ncbi:GYDIA family GHMP kinase [Neolewinella litorea]|uniref:GHMP kinase n=1 Tax=Neolewinella litorea TaxID=2562452 RepID=A0A4S4NJ82_9BACT|nr:GYDIA family GHMP kinase [Neolewinella litorea]THH39832.1 GHMP kinase [Neolewinella litorea]
MHHEREFYGHGKLLLLGEYFVLDGATALAVPTRRGQRFRVTPRPSDSAGTLEWTMEVAGDPSAHRRFAFTPDEWRAAPTDEDPVRHRLLQLFHVAEQLLPGATRKLADTQITTTLEFDPAWGLGSSSTLVWFLSEWLGVNAYELLERTFGGSGYDLACAGAEGPLLYSRNGSRPTVTELDWRPEWLESTCFVYRNRKQNSREALQRYATIDIDVETIWEAGQMSRLFLQAPHLRAAARVATAYERLIADELGLTPVQEEHFRDFDGTVKSLGAWGGDFVWAISEAPLENTRAYFNERGYPTVIPYNDMVL